MKKLILILSAIVSLFATLAVGGAIAFAEENVSVYVNENKIEFTDKSAEIIDGRTYVPTRGVFEELGYLVEWEENTKTVVLKNQEKEIKLTIDNATASITFGETNETIILENMPVISEGRAMLPLRAVTELTEYEVEWNSENKTVKILYSAETEENLNVKYDFNTEEGQKLFANDIIAVTYVLVGGMDGDEFLPEYADLKDKYYEMIKEGQSLDKMFTILRELQEELTKRGVDLDKIKELSEIQEFIRQNF